MKDVHCVVYPNSAKISHAKGACFGVTLKELYLSGVLFGGFVLLGKPAHANPSFPRASWVN